MVIFVMSADRSNNVPICDATNELVSKLRGLADIPVSNIHMGNKCPPVDADPFFNLVHARSTVQYNQKEKQPTNRDQK